MKKILFAAVAAMAITGCSQNEEIEKAAQPVEIGFNTAVSKTTRATTLVNADFTKFTAYAYSTTGAFADATAVNALIPGTDFELKESAWSSGNSVFYWPATDQVSFFAFSPNTTEQLSWGAAVAKTAPTLTYTVKDAVKDQEDLVVAEAMNKQKAISGTTEAVALNFKHALTKIGFKIKGEGSGITYTLNKVVIKAKNKGVYTYATSTTEATLGTWAISDDVTTTTSYTIEPATALSITGADGGGTANETLVGADYTAMLIPQDLTGVTFEIYYKAEAGGAMLFDKTTTPEEITFATGNWTAGQSIAYILTLKGAEKMTITGSVAENWDFTDTPK
ncbi:fimbrillin family protein [Bacteroides fragilis]